jgi:hypothetical protein
MVQPGSSQTVRIPGNTGYAIPAENETVDMFAEKSGTVHWKDRQQTLHYFFYLRKPGKLQLQVLAKNAGASAMLEVTLAGKVFNTVIPKTDKFTERKIGILNIKDSGFYEILLQSKKGTVLLNMEIQSILLSGSATQQMQFNAKARRNAASVHLRYPIADSVKAISFYNEITIPTGADIVHSYYMACGFARGYFGIQVNSATERRVIFSVWDAGKEAVDRNKVADSNKVQLLAKGEGVFADGFGNEGTGGHSHWVYPWQTGTTYKMLVTALTDSATETTIYSGYFYLPEMQRWKLIASFRAPKDGKPLHNLYSFNENFVGVNGQLLRKAFFGNQWIQKQNGQWQELTQSSFSYDATGKAGDRIDYGGGVNEGRFYLENGGFKIHSANYGDIFNRLPGNNRPSPDFNKNADSAVQAVKDQQLINEAVAQKKIDTPFQVEGIYYQMIKEGTGDYVSLNDTVTVFYKGSLLKDGTVFDQTKEKTVSFPLTRLIKGWQLALPKCRVGGKISFVVPSRLGYTIRARSKAIPPNSILLFEVEVVKTKKPLSS